MEQELKVAAFFIQGGEKQGKGAKGRGDNIVPTGSIPQNAEGRRGIEEGSHSHQLWVWQGMTVCMSWGLSLLLTGTSGCDYDKQRTETVAI